MQLWEEFAKGGVLLSPGWYFSADQENIPDGKYEGHYRISFGGATVRAVTFVRVPDPRLTFHSSRIWRRASTSSPRS